VAGWDPAVMLANPSFTSIWNLTGFPALSVNCGFTEAGLPIGMQIVGRPFDEPTVFKVGDAYQQITDWHTRRPTLPVEEAIPA
jgi:aspartyl-tRNA(Asn)/glutamyl-tRNA(Gln) amidotransferase subunit A